MTAWPGGTVDPVVAHALAGAAALVFVVGAAQKWRDHATFRAALGAYRLLPEVLVGPAALALPALELIAGVALCAPPFRTAGALLALVLLAIVTSAVAINLGRGRADIDCGCGGPEGQQRLSWGLVVRNALLMVAVALATAGEGTRELGTLDYATSGLAALAFYLVYATASQLLANRPRLSQLQTH